MNYLPKAEEIGSPRLQPKYNIVDDPAMDDDPFIRLSSIKAIAANRDPKRDCTGFEVWLQQRFRQRNSLDSAGTNDEKCARNQNIEDRSLIRETKGAVRPKFGSEKLTKSDLENQLHPRPRIIICRIQGKINGKYPLPSRLSFDTLKTADKLRLHPNFSKNSVKRANIIHVSDNEDRIRNQRVNRHRYSNPFGECSTVDPLQTPEEKIEAFAVRDQSVSSVLSVKKTSTASHLPSVENNDDTETRHNSQNLFAKIVQSIRRLDSSDSLEPPTSNPSLVNPLQNIPDMRRALAMRGQSVRGLSSMLSSELPTFHTVSTSSVEEDNESDTGTPHYLRKAFAMDGYLIKKLDSSDYLDPATSNATLVHPPHTPQEKRRALAMRGQSVRDFSNVPPSLDRTMSNASSLSDVEESDGNDRNETRYDRRKAFAVSGQFIEVVGPSDARHSGTSNATLFQPPPHMTQEERRAFAMRGQSVRVFSSMSPSLDRTISNASSISGVEVNDDSDTESPPGRRKAFAMSGPLVLKVGSSDSLGTDASTGSSVHASQTPEDRRRALAMRGQSVRGLSSVLSLDRTVSSSSNLPNVEKGDDSDTETPNDRRKAFTMSERLVRNVGSNGSLDTDSSTVLSVHPSQTPEDRRRALAMRGQSVRGISSMLSFDRTVSNASSLPNVEEYDDSDADASCDRRKAFATSSHLVRKTGSSDSLDSDASNALTVHPSQSHHKKSRAVVMRGQSVGGVSSSPPSLDRTLSNASSVENIEEEDNSDTDTPHDPRKAFALERQIVQRVGSNDSLDPTTVKASFADSLQTPQEQRKALAMQGQSVRGFSSMHALDRSTSSTSNLMTFGKDDDCESLEDPRKAFALKHQRVRKTGSNDSLAQTPPMTSLADSSQTITDERKASAMQGQSVRGFSSMLSLERSTSSASSPTAVEEGGQGETSQEVLRSAFLTKRQRIRRISSNDSLDPAASIASTKDSSCGKAGVSHLHKKLLEIETKVCLEQSDKMSQQSSVTQQQGLKLAAPLLTAPSAGDETENRSADLQEREIEEEYHLEPANNAIQLSESVPKELSSELTLEQPQVTVTIQPEEDQFLDLSSTLRQMTCYDVNPPEQPTFNESEKSAGDYIKEAPLMSLDCMADEELMAYFEGVPPKSFESLYDELMDDVYVADQELLKAFDYDFGMEEVYIMQVECNVEGTMSKLEHTERTEDVYIELKSPSPTTTPNRVQKKKRLKKHKRTLVEI